MSIKSIVKIFLIRNRVLSVHISNILNLISVYLQVYSRKIIQNINQETSDSASEWFVFNKLKLLGKIKEIIKCLKIP